MTPLSERDRQKIRERFANAECQLTIEAQEGLIATSNELPLKQLILIKSYVLGENPRSPSEALARVHYLARGLAGYHDDLPSALRGYPPTSADPNPSNLQNSIMASIAEALNRST